MKILQATSVLNNSELSPLKQIHIRSHKYTVRLAENRAEVEQAQRLRFDVFNVEFSKGLTDSYKYGRDQDEFDPFCHHLVVIENQSNTIIGTYRMQDSRMAEEGRGFYTSAEFSVHLFPSEVLLNSLELGRACIHKNHRNGRVLFLLWKGIAEYVQLKTPRYLFGCCSLPSQNLHESWAVFNYLKRNGHLHPQHKILVEPKYRCPAPSLTTEEAEVEIPKLFQLYLQIGAKVCSPPALDQDFGTIDFLILLDLKKLNPQTKNLFFG